MLAVLVAAVWWPIGKENQRRKIGRDERTGAPGRFAKLSQGVTYYRWFGPVRGPVLVAIHGFSTPSVIWEPLAEEMGALGYRVLTYDLYGHGLSDAPEGAQDRQFFLQQLNDLLTDQDISDEIAVVGHCLGGSIAVAFAETTPHRLLKLILVAPAGVQTNESRFTRFCRVTPFIGDWVHSTFGPRRMAMAIEEDAAAAERPAVRKAQLAELERRGYISAVLSSRRCMLAEKQKEAHQKISREDVPVIALWGDEDQVIPISALGLLAQWNRIARQETILGAGHGLLYSHPEETKKAIRDMLVGR